jgi:hypothetical protein
VERKGDSPIANRNAAKYRSNILQWPYFGLQKITHTLLSSAGADQWGFHVFQQNKQFPNAFFRDSA